MFVGNSLHAAVPPGGMIGILKLYAQGVLGGGGADSEGRRVIARRGGVERGEHVPKMGLFRG